MSDRLGRPIGIVDSVVIDHMRPSGISGLYQRVGGVAKAAEEQTAFKARFGVRDEVFALTDKGHAGHGDVVTVANTDDRQDQREAPEQRRHAGAVGRR